MPTPTPQCIDCNRSLTHGTRALTHGTLTIGGPRCSQCAHEHDHNPTHHPNRVPPTHPLNNPESDPDGWGA